MIAVVAAIVPGNRGMDDRSQVLQQIGHKLGIEAIGKDRNHLGPARPRVAKVV
jgi:hypothetical protein